MNGTVATAAAPAVDEIQAETLTEALDASDLPWWTLFIAVVFAALGFVAPPLWLFAALIFGVWFAGFHLRRPDTRWYCW